MLLLRNADILAPDPRGRADILLAGGRVERIAPGLSLPPGLADVVDATAHLAVPGFIDCHVHILGGGGEGGYATRTPELLLSDAVRGGVTTVVGCLGTDGVTRSLPALLAKARGLDEEGISTFIYSGHYSVPLQPMTGSIERDLLLIDKVIGSGEVAISDHRSTQPTFDELARVAAETRRGGILSGKAGVVNVHLGDGRRGLALLRRLVEETEIPSTQFLPTHMNRNAILFEEAIDWARAGGLADFTTSTVPDYIAEGEVPAALALRRMIDAGAPVANLTFSSDGQGSLPRFDAAGRLVGLDVGRVTSLFAAVREAVREQGVALETALSLITANPARILKLSGKGRLAEGADADLVLLDPDALRVTGVIARGRWLMRDGELLARGTFE
jgi:beta-aspartyl-dipeptidase (metallo-type)